MTSRLALGATVAATVLLSINAGASAQTYEVTKLVPGSAFHGVHGLGIDKAGRLFASMATDPQVPDTIRNRAQQIAGTLGIDVSAAPAQAGQPGTSE